MKGSELRIGNYIELDNEGYSKVIGITDFNNSISVEYPDGEEIFDEDLDGYKPIRISKFWLLKFGFEIKEGNKFKFFHKEKDRTYIDISNPICITYNNANGILKIIDYVHEIQNLFYAINKEELTAERHKN